MRSLPGAAPPAVLLLWAVGARESAVLLPEGFCHEVAYAKASLQEEGIIITTTTEGVLALLSAGTSGSLTMVIPTVTTPTLPIIITTLIHTHTIPALMRSPRYTPRRNNRITGIIVQTRRVITLM